LLAFGSTKFMGLQSGGNVSEMPDSAFRNLSEGGDLHEAAKNLFMMLRDLDNPNHAAIAVMDIPNHGIGIAINERLSRAAHG
jgi:L-threonylcarbamoyladenylate synthase